MEQTTREISRGLQGKDVGSVEEMNAFRATLTGGGLKSALEGAPPMTPKEEAQQPAWRAKEASGGLCSALDTID